MKTPILAAIAAIALLGMIPSAKAEVIYPYCLMITGRNAAENCGFVSFAQCRASQFGQGGTCMQNPRYAVRDEEQPRRWWRPRH